MAESRFGRYGTGGRVPGKYPIPSDDNGGNFDLAMASDGTDDLQPDSKGDVYQSTFGAAEHNPAGAADSGDNTKS